MGFWAYEIAEETYGFPRGPAFPYDDAMRGCGVVTGMLSIGRSESGLQAPIAALLPDAWVITAWRSMPKPRPRVSARGYHVHVSQNQRESARRCRRWR